MKPGNEAGLVSIHTKFELSMCIVCPTIEINMSSAYLKNGLVGRSAGRKHCNVQTSAACKQRL